MWLGDETGVERTDAAGGSRRARFQRGDAAFLPLASGERLNWTARAGLLCLELDPGWFALASPNEPASRPMPSHCIRLSDRMTRELGADLHAAATRRDPDRAEIGETIEVLVEHLWGQWFPPRPVRLDPSSTAVVHEVAARIHRDPTKRYRVGELAQAAGLTRFELSRRFRRVAGMSISEYLQRARIDRAKALLDDAAMPLAEVALAAGFFDQSHFTRVFRRYVGMPPGAFQRAAVVHGCA